MGPRPSRKGKEREAGKFIEEMKGVFNETEAALKEAASDMKRFYNRGQWPDNLKVGDKVWLDTQDLRTDHPNKKLDYKQVSPFEIILKHGPMVYKLQLPKMYKVHPIFPAVKLTKAKDNKWERPVFQVTLKVWDPATGEFVRSMKWKSVKGIKISPDIFNKILWWLNPESYPDQTTMPWH